MAEKSAENATVASLIYVVQQSAGQVKMLGQRLESASTTGKESESILRRLADEADTLSSGLARLSHYAENLPSDEDAEEDSTPDAELLRLTDLLAQSLVRGFCDHCGGVNHWRTYPLS